MELIICLSVSATIILVFVGIFSLIDGGVKIMAGFFACAGATAALAAIFNWGLVTRNATPVHDGGRVTVISHTLDKDTAIPKITVNSGIYICEDGNVKCADIALGDIIVGQKWAEDGWTWRFRPSQIEATR